LKGNRQLVSGTVLALACRRLRTRGDDALVPLMGMLGAFVFTAQMVNFSIPATGSSGHLGGGLLLAILLGADAAFVVMASVLVVQALFFADGGLLALGANLFNLGVVPCFVAYGVVYKPLAGLAPTPRRAGFAAVAAALLALQAGAAVVALQTVASGISSLSLPTFAALLLPIHAAIGLVEGLATAALLVFLMRTWPELLQAVPASGSGGLRALLRKLALATVLTGGVLSWFASTRPDGLEWALAHAADTTAPVAPPGEVHAVLGALQQHSAWLAGYEVPTQVAPAHDSRSGQPPPWPDVNGSSSMAGLVGHGRRRARQPVGRSCKRPETLQPTRFRRPRALGCGDRLRQRFSEPRFGARSPGNTRKPSLRINRVWAAIDPKQAAAEPKDRISG